MRRPLPRNAPTRETPRIGARVMNAASLPDLREFASSVFGAVPSDAVPLTGGGSDRRYFRLAVKGASIVGAISDNLAELRAFIAFTRHFAARGIPVPTIHGVDESHGLYLMEDLGPVTLRDHLAALRGEPDGRARAERALHEAIRWLPVIQVRGGAGLDYTVCLAQPGMNGTTYAGDIRLFLDQFVARYAPGMMPPPEAGRAMDELIVRASALDSTHFCYRDFQTRNIMWRAGHPVYIDYQSGRRGPLAYDVASILYSPDSGLDDDERSRLIDTYLESLKECGITQERTAFLRAYHLVVLLRRMQALGAYGRLALEKGKLEFLTLVPASLHALRSLLRPGAEGLDFPALRDWLLAVFDRAEVTLKGDQP
jgi:aminoglycoside/choline kinase family phosphotransferase